MRRNNIFNNDPFPEIIGQEAVKKKLNFFLHGQRKDGIVPPIMFTSAFGDGKTTITSAFASRLYNRKKTRIKRLIKVNATAIANLTHFFETWLLPHVVGPDVKEPEVTIFIDEAHNLPEGVEQALLTILEPNKNDYNDFDYAGASYRFDLREITWITATTDPQKLSKALVNRFEQISLSSYTPEELGQILMARLPNIRVKTSLLTEIASVLRGCARDADKMGAHIQKYMKFMGGNEFGPLDWEALSSGLSILPLGLNEMELQVLRKLRENGAMSLTDLSGSTRQNRAALQFAIETYLSAHNLIKKTSSGREITTAGKKLLDKLDKSS